MAASRRCEGPIFPFPHLFVIASEEKQSRAAKHKCPQEIAPLRIFAFDQLQLPLPRATLERLLAQDRILHRGVKLEPNKHLAAILLGKSVDHALSMLPRALNEVRGDTNV
jgi:hypothetical protein